MNDKIDIVLNIADHANKTLTNGDLIIPILDNFEIIEQSQNSNNRFFVAKNGNTLEQFIVDGQLNNSESLEEHIKIVNQSIADSIEMKILYLL